MKLSKIIFIILIISNVVGVTFVAMKKYDDLIKNEREILNLYSARLKHAIEAEIMVTEMIEEVIMMKEGYLSEAEFHKLGKIISTSLVKSSITYIPDGVIEYIYPPEFAEGVVGQDVFVSEKTAPDSIMARDSKNIVIQGPYELFEGSYGIVIRNPVYYDGKFWGLIAVAIDSEDLFRYVGLDFLEKQGYEFQLTTPKVLAKKSHAYGIEEAVFNNVQIDSIIWNFGLYIKDKTHIVVTDAMFWFLIFLFINFILYSLLQKFEKSKDYLARKLETDSLTGAYNRVKLNKYYEKEQGKAFALFFIDLNKFKPVNDNYGHKVGDKLLKAYTERLKNEMMADTLIVRIGGDEFIVVTPNVVDEVRAAKIKRKLVNLSEMEFAIDKLRINISASIGYVLSAEAGSLEALLAIADEKMYNEKANRAR